ncbi:WD40-repeat-containing domain protein [Zopfochytrium polystomum]|nr:WD40-repeat-containing domain protein [Zopfochytrium polystomum]
MKAALQTHPCTPSIGKPKPQHRKPLLLPLFGGPAMPRVAGIQAEVEVDDGDRGSSSSYGTYGAGSEVEKLMPPTLKDAESSDFALAATTGPAFGHIRALDVTSLPSGAIVAASAGGDDRSDRRISVWDARSGQLLTQLDNGTHKPVVALAFHPSLPNHLLAADMEFDVKLWNWEEGHILWDTSLDKPSISSVHANEPFTSFVFCGDTAGQTLIASLSYSIRIYKMRTLTLLHTIHLKDIKLNKTPISFISSHPLVDQVVLLSCDNQLRMFHLQSETTLRVFSSRELPSGTRIEGRFSPCGTFVYSGSWDSRTFSSTRSVGAAAAAAAAASAAAAAAGGGSLRLRDAQAWGSLGGETGCSPLDAKGDPGGGGGGGGGGAPLYGPGSGPRGSPEATGVYIWRVATAHLERAEMKAMEEGGGGRKCPVTMCRWIKAKDVSRHTGSGGGGGGGGRKVLVAAGLDRSLRTFM